MPGELLDGPHRCPRHGEVRTEDVPEDVGTVGLTGLPATAGCPTRAKLGTLSRNRMDTIDFQKELRQLYRARREIEEIEAPRGTFLRINGEGEPGGQEFESAVGAIYSVACPEVRTQTRRGR